MAEERPLSGGKQTSAEALESHGIAVKAITTDRPGYITFEDKYQIAAEPFADTPT